MLAILYSFVSLGPTCFVVGYDVVLMIGFMYLETHWKRRVLEISENVLQFGPNVVLLRGGKLRSGISMLIVS